MSESEPEKPGVFVGFCSVGVDTTEVAEHVVLEELRWKCWVVF